jgi:copper(I)-binding protein
LTAAALLGLVGGLEARESGKPTLEIQMPWARASAGMAKTGAAYLTIVSHGEAADRLIAAASPVARKAEIHGHSMEGGVMRMRPVAAVEIAPGQATVLEPGGLHVMLIGLHSPLAPGQRFPLTLSFESAGDIEVEVAVHAPGAPAPAAAHGQEQAAGEQQHGGQTMTHMAQDKTEMEPAHRMASAMPASCDPEVHVTEAAERKPGGAHYAGPLPRPGARPDTSMPEMEGAHMDHRSRHGGAFYMASNRLHHLEAVYSEQCGFRVYFYNAFIEPIRAGRFQAFVRIQSAEEDMFEIIRFLSPSQDGVTLRTPIGVELKRPFNVELFVKLPATEEPEIFTMRVP